MSNPSDSESIQGQRAVYNLSTDAVVPRLVVYSLEVNLFTIFRETSGRLDTLTNRAREGKDLQAAKDFGSYLMWSGVLKLLVAHSDSQPASLRYDAAHLEWKCQKLLSLVHDQFRQPSKVISLELSQMEAINHKLDLIAGRMAQIPVCKPDSNASPVLTIVNEGVA